MSRAGCRNLVRSLRTIPLATGIPPSSLELILQIEFEMMNSRSSTFKCKHTGCNAVYRRKEHLTRHMVHHDQPQRCSCPYCDSTLARRFVNSTRIFLLLMTHWYSETYYADTSANTIRGRTYRHLALKRLVEAAELERNAVTAETPAIDASAGIPPAHVSIFRMQSPLVSNSLTLS